MRLVELGSSGHSARSSKVHVADTTPSENGLERSLGSAVVVYVHGIGEQPSAATLMRQYDKALFGQEVGERSRLAYWADILHPQGNTEAALARVMSVGGARTDSALTDDDLNRLLPSEADWPDDVRDQMLRLGCSRQREPASRRAAIEWGRRLTDQMQAAALGGSESELAVKWQSANVGRSSSVGRFNAKVLPAGPFREWLTRQLTWLFMDDVYQYLFHAEIQERIQARLRDLLVPGGGPYVIVSHSLGTVIAHDVLHQLSREAGDRLRVPLWIMLGSPLGIDEVQDGIERGAGGQLSSPTVVTEWRNYADPLDPVALDKTVADEFRKGTHQSITDELNFQNLDSQRIQGFNPHSALGYIGHPTVREVVRNQLDANFASPTADFVIARDIATEMSGHSNRMPVLIELREEHCDATLAETQTPAETQEKRRGRLEARLREMVRDTAQTESAHMGDAVQAAHIDPLQRYIAAQLTPHEIALLRAERDHLSINRIWKNSRKRAFMHVAAQRIQTYTARLGYGASGEGIGWAVVDTGIAATHPHFNVEGQTPTVAAQWNCTIHKPLDAKNFPETAKANDENGHGTHVAGLIAGYGKTKIEGKDEELFGMAARTRLHVYQVLNRNGDGDDSYIIKALDHVARTNEQAGRLVIHGVNLSLGDPFDASVYGCGHSPLCRELRRLWQMGVLVCVAAGNEGTLRVNSSSGDEVDLNVDLSIGDPANLNEAIAVGSVSRDFPHLYGVSYFSSRGPTADGRAKPDVVAPGEQIWSCNYRFDKSKESGRSNLPYIPESGTSMACPNVSGLLAAFLSVRREYIGRPDEVKRLLLQHATDLGRDRYHQGAGMPNLVKMLAGT